MRNRKVNFFIVTILVALLTYVAINGLGSIKGANQMRYGIDIRGGVDAVFVPEGLDRKPTTDEMDAARAVIESRLDNQNILDREVTVDKEQGQIIVRFPWKSDETNFNPETAIAELGETARLTFRDTEGNIMLEGQRVKNSMSTTDPETGAAVVQLEFDSQGAAQFEEATGKLVGKPMGIYMDEELISQPTVNQKISGGKAVITGMSNFEEATALSEKINSGALPFSMTTKNHSSISPILGSGALNIMIMAGLLAFILVCLFMIINYRLPGVISCIALTLQMVGQLLALSIPQFTLTLPGIAGIILSLGMGLDANIIITERIGDELRKSKNLSRAIELGFHNAFSSVFDGNITASIVAIILMIFGSGTMLSFGYTLLIGLIFNFIAGVFTTKILIKSITLFKPMQNLKLFRITKEKTPKRFYEKRFITYAISGAVILIGLISCFTNGVRLDTMFTGGAIIKYTFVGEAPNTDEIAQLAGSTIDREASAQITSDLATGENKIVLTLAGTNGISPQEQQQLGTALTEKYPDASIAVSESYVVEPYIGQRSLNRSIFAILLSFALITIYVWIRFYKISGLSAAVMALIALAHDVIVVFFIFVIFKMPLNDSFVAVVLTIIGYSINDTIVIYDRIRENKRSGKQSVIELVNESITQTFTRSLNTSIATAICVFIIYVFAQLYGITSIQVFALPMFFGVVSGSYSTICLAGPLWVAWQLHKNKDKKLKTA